MTEAERREFYTVLVNCLAGYYRQQNVDANLLGFWFDGLRRFQLEDIAAALSRHATDTERGQWPPKIADVVRQIEGNATTSSGRAWAKVERAIRCIGGYSSVVFDDPLIHAAIADMGGWSRLCRGTVDELPFVARDFERRYQGYRAQQATPAYPSHLIGQCEADALRMGFRPDPPRLMGDADRCRLVFERGGAASLLPAAERGAASAREAMRHALTDNPRPN